MASDRNGDRNRDTDDTPDRRGEEADRQAQNGDGERDDRRPGKSPLANPWVKIALVVIVLLLIAGGVIWWLIARHYEDTDDAFIDTHIVHVSPQIAGQVLAVHVNDNQRVRAGEPLVDIDARTQTAQLEQTMAQRVQALTQIQQAEAQERAAQAQVTNTSRDLARYRGLMAAAPLAVAQQQVDQAQAAERNAVAQRDQAAAQIAGAKAQIKVLDAQIATAQLNLGYARVVAPVDGHVAQRSVAPGNYVSPGQELMAIVPDRLWVTANFKETQLALMRRGQHVRVTVDSCDKDIDGHVDSIQRGAGQAFGILPPENATGNYVKVVQRVPVKIILDHVPDGCILGPGMSVEPTVTVR
ncbi:MAG TPA: HlyD family secretion protein [Rhizomicrobium sp.]|jgi:membrane fusion protein (multidrug efflux system)|nr:HlyD family secretion protein [Rhizomicrobium sp.]